MNKKGPPSDSLLGPHIQSICEALDIPHIETRFDIDHGAKEFSINLYPQQKKLNDAILDTVKYLNWTRYAIIYEGNKSYPERQHKFIYVYKFRIKKKKRKTRERKQSRILMV